MKKTILLYVLILFASTQMNAQQTGCISGDCYTGYGTYKWKSGSKYVGDWKDNKRHGYGSYFFNNGAKYIGKYVYNKMQGYGTYYFSNGDKYTGYWKNGNYHGKGTYTYGSGKWKGDKYVGNWEKDKKHGEGTYFYSSGRVKKGFWKNGSYFGEKIITSGCISGDCNNGYGTYIWSNGDKYVGNWKNKKLNGQGKYYWVSGTVYDGEWKDGNRNGFGKNKSASGKVKEGMWEDNRYVGTSKNNYGCVSGDCVNGYGVYTWNTEDRYEGYFKNNERNGQGEYTWPSGNKYIGKWAKGKQNGQGIMYYKSGSEKSGYWKDGSYVGTAPSKTGCISGDCDNGYGTYISSKGDKYIGTFQNTKYHGSGTLSYSNGSKYIGEFSNGTFSGQGAYTFANMKDKYIGSFLNGMYNGQGTFYYANGTTKAGTWKNNEYVVSVADNSKPPIVSWLTPSSNSTKTEIDSYELKLCVKTDSDLENIQIYVNDEIQINSVVRGYSVVSTNCDNTIKRSIKLKNGINKIKAVIKNAKGSTTSQIINVEYIMKTKTTEKKYALVMGNSDYISSPLRNPVNDAKAIAAELKSLGFDVMLYTNISQTDMKRNIRTFGNKLSKNKGTGLFYFAGHGLQLNGENYLVPVDAKIEKEQDVELEAVNLKRILGEMDYAQNGMNIVILDACRNNPFARSMRSGGGNGLASTKAPKGTFIAFATSPGSVAADGTGKNGLYTQELLKMLRIKGLKIEDVFKKVRKNVYLKSNEKQVPWENSSIFDDFYFNK